MQPEASAPPGDRPASPAARETASPLRFQGYAATRPGVRNSAGDAQLANPAPCLRVAGARGPPATGTPDREALQARLCTAGLSPPEGFGERIRAALGDRGPKANSRERPRAGTRSRDPARSSGNCPFPDPGVPHSAHRLPSGSSERPPPPPDHPGPRRRTASSPHPAGHARKALGPRVRPRHPPVGPGDSTARVSPKPAQRARPTGLLRLLGLSPHRALRARTRMGRGTWGHPEPWLQGAP